MPNEEDNALSFNVGIAGVARAALANARAKAAAMLAAESNARVVFANASAKATAARADVTAKGKRLATLEAR
jgi:hypothetical protein